MRLAKCLGFLVFLSILGLASDSFAQSNSLPRVSAAEAGNHLNQQVVVEDIVAQVAMRSNIWLLHLNQKYPKSPLNAVVRKGNTNNFPNFNDYLGRRVEITGQITEYRGRLELAMTTTNQIKILSPAPSVAAPVMASAEARTKPVVPALQTVPMTPVSVAVDENKSGPILIWILALLAVISVLLATAIFLFWRRPNLARATGPAGGLVKAEDNRGDLLAPEDWKQRALAAEAMAGRQGQVLRDKMIPELTEFAKQSLVQGLYAQRDVLMETQRKAQLALAELESRLKTIQAPLHERIHAYEQRIAELEREVETQGDEVRELTHATLILVRKKLEDERQSGRLQSRFN